MLIGCVFVRAQVDRDRAALMVQAFKQLNTQYNRRTATSGAPLLVHRVKVQFKDEPGEGSGVARSFFTAFAQVRIALCAHACALFMGLLSLSSSLIVIFICNVTYRHSLYNYMYGQRISCQSLLLCVCLAQAVLSSERLPPLDGILVGGLLQKLRLREREKERRAALKSAAARHRESRRSLSYDAPPFYPRSVARSSDILAL